MSTTFQSPIPHSLNEKEQAYIASLSPQEKELHLLAVKMLGSSYFVGKTHGFAAWIKKQEPKK